MSEAPKPPPYRNIATAPFVHFDVVVSNGTLVRLIELDLAARTLVPSDGGGVEVEIVTTARLRCNPVAAFRTARRDYEFSRHVRQDPSDHSG